MCGKELHIQEIFHLVLNLLQTVPPFSLLCQEYRISVSRFEVSGWLILTYDLLICNNVLFGRYIAEF